MNAGNIKVVQIIDEIRVPEPSTGGRKVEQNAVTLPEFSGENSRSVPSVAVSDRGGDCNAIQDENPPSRDANPPLWKPICNPLNGDIRNHRANGNCLFYSLYEASGGDETLGTGEESGINVRNLKQHIVASQVSDLRSKCAAFGINYELLLSVEQDMVKRGQLRINPAESAYQILADERAINEIFDGYNANLPEGNRVDFGDSQMKGVVCQALDIILMCGNDRCYMDAANVKSVAQILKRTILLINADSSVSVELSGEVDSCTLYNPDGSVKTFQIDRSGKVFDRDANASPVFPENAIVIAKNAMHFYGRPSFSQNGLHVLAEGLKKPVRSFRDLGINFENQGAEDALDMCENVPNLEDVASLFQCISGAEDALDVCEDVPNLEDVASLFQCISGAEDAFDVCENVPNLEDVASLFQCISGAEDAFDVCEDVPNLEDVASLFQCISGAEDALDVCEDVPNPEDAASLFQCSSGAEDALDMYEDVPETASVVFATDPRQIGKGRKIRKAKQCQRNAPYHGAATHSKAEVHKPNFASQGN